MKKEINYILPDFMAYGRNELLIKFCNKYPVIKGNDFCIHSFYGTFPRAIWNGGRVNIFEKKSSKKEMTKVRDFYNKLGISITFTFTNSLIEEEHLNDEYCNMMLKVFNNSKNEILVVSPILEKYLREKYPNYKINKSITFADSKNPCDTKNYNLSVIEKHFNRNIEFLENIKEKEKIEILCDELCENNCPYTKQHYNEISNIQLNGLEVCSNEYYGKCRFLNKYDKYNRIQYRNQNSIFYISPNDIVQIYLPLGFKYFKLSGRERFYVWGYSSIIDYLILPKYQKDIRSYVYERLLQEAMEFFEKTQNEDSEYRGRLGAQNWRYV